MIESWYASWSLLRSVILYLMLTRPRNYVMGANWSLSRLLSPSLQHSLWTVIYGLLVWTFSINESTTLVFSVRSHQFKFEGYFKFTISKVAVKVKFPDFEKKYIPKGYNTRNQLFYNLALNLSDNFTRAIFLSKRADNAYTVLKLHFWQDNRIQRWSSKAHLDQGENLRLWRPLTYSSTTVTQ